MEIRARPIEVLFLCNNSKKGAGKSRMNPGTVIDVSILVSVSSLLIAAATFFSSRKKDIQQDSQGVLKANMKLDQICATTNETRSDIKAINSQIQALTERQIKTEAEIRTIWKRIDEIRDEIKEEIRKENEA